MAPSSLFWGRNQDEKGRIIHKKVRELKFTDSSHGGQRASYLFMLALYSEHMRSKCCRIVISSLVMDSLFRSRFL